MNGYRVEKHIYELLGIRKFQKMTFILEKIVHRNDNGYNENYHFKKVCNQVDIQKFIKYLFYNGIIHIRNLFFISVFMTVKIMLKWLSWFDSIIILLALKDIYCVMLQRYNYIRIKNYIELQNKKHEIHINRMMGIMSNEINNKYDFKYCEQDMKFINKFMDCISKNEVIKFSHEDIESLKRIMELRRTDSNA